MRSSLCFTGNSQLSSHRHGDFQICSGPGGSNCGASPNCVSPRRTCDQFSPAPCVAVARSIFIIQFRSHFGLFFLLGNFIAFHTANAIEHANCASSVNLLAPRPPNLIGTKGTKTYWHQGHSNLLAPGAPNLICTKVTLRPSVALFSLVYWYCRSCGLAARGTPTATSPG